MIQIKIILNNNQAQPTIHVDNQAQPTTQVTNYIQFNSINDLFIINIYTWYTAKRPKKKSHAHNKIKIIHGNIQAHGMSYGSLT